MSDAQTSLGDLHALKTAAKKTKTRFHPAQFWRWGAGPAWLLAAVITWKWPDADDFPATNEFAVFQLVIGLALVALGATGYLKNRAPWALTLGVGFGAWEVVQAKLLLLPRPFFGTPQDLLDVFLTDWKRLGDSLLHSLLLLAGGYIPGSILGIIVGLALGRSHHVRYWVRPIMRVIGPLPPVALLPLAFVVIPSTRGAGEALMALAAGFPVAVLTWSGVSAVDPSYYDVARTMGAKNRFLVLRVALPAATPQIFVGLFMGLGASFSMLVVAEMLGVKSGLGFYMQWAQGWAAYPNMYAALFVMSFMCTTLMTVLFKIRDHLLKWQKDGLKW